MLEWSATQLLGLVAAGAALGAAATALVWGHRGSPVATLQHLLEEKERKKKRATSPDGSLPPPVRSPHDASNALPSFVEHLVARDDPAAPPIWRLYYWPGTAGRGEFMRLLWVFTDTPYEDVFASKHPEDLEAYTVQLKKPFFAFPAISHGDFFLSQTPVIVRYLAKKLAGGALYPKEARDRYQADVLMAGVVDLVAEGHHAWHAIDPSAGYEAQKEATEPFIGAFKAKRLPKWLAYFEAALQRNNDGQGTFLGTEVTYVDVCIFHALDGIASQCPEEWAHAYAPLLKAFHARMAALPRIAAYLHSPQRTPYTHNGPTF